jgi:exopolysaccharide biosynthesis polyprenyl glycosylphosphotransferase
MENSYLLVSRLGVADALSTACENEEDATRRVCDLVIACALIVLTLPLMVLVALAIKLDSFGPVFYRQERVGLGGRCFMLLKFRSMINDSEPDGRPVWAAERDIRVTRVGRFIRCLRIDELPQLFNVLCGEMSLVGPRPERPYFVDQLTAIIPSFAGRHTVKPGITGWAQINLPYGASISDARKKLCYDLHYIRNRTAALDLVILLSTVRVVLFKKGAR